jgi:signal transduction histidine kinase/CheY-like chemotaxis protein
MNPNLGNRSHLPAYAAGKRRAVLVVDDTRDTRERIRRRTSEIYGGQYELLEAESAKRALQLLNQNKLLDISVVAVDLALDLPHNIEAAIVLIEELHRRLPSSRILAYSLLPLEGDVEGRVRTAGASRYFHTDDVERVITQVFLETDLQELQRTNPLVERVLNTVKIGLSIQDPQMNILWANEATRKMNALGAARIEGRRCWLCYHSFDNRKKACADCVAWRVVTKARTAIEQKDSLEYEEHEDPGELLLPVGGQIERVEVNASPLLSTDGKEVLAVIEATQLVTSEWEKTTSADARLREVLDAAWELTAHDEAAPQCRSIALYYRPKGVSAFYLFEAAGSKGQPPKLLRIADAPEEYRRVINSRTSLVVRALQPAKECHHFLLSDTVTGPLEATLLIDAEYSDSKPDGLFTHDLLPYWDYLLKVFGAAHKARETAFVTRSHNEVEEFLADAARRAARLNLNADELVQLAISHVKKAVSPCSMHLRVLDRRTNCMVMKKGYGFGPYYEIAPEKRLLRSSLQSGDDVGSVRAAASRQPIVEREASPNAILRGIGREASSSEKAEIARITGFATLPLMLGKRVFGTLNVQFEDDSLCYESKLSFLTAMATALSSALAWVEWNRERRLMADHFRKLDSMMFKPSPFSGPAGQENQMLDCAVDMAFELTYAEYVVYYQHDPREKVLVLISQARLDGDASALRAPSTLPASAGLVGEAMRRRQTMAALDCSEDQWLALRREVMAALRGESDRAFCRNIACEIAIPVLVGDNVDGVLVATSSISDWLTQDDVVVLEEFGFKMGLCLEAMRTKRTLAQEYSSIDSINKVYAAMGRTTDESVLIRQLLLAVTTRECLGFTRAVLFLKRSQGENLLPGALAVGAYTREAAHRGWNEADSATLDKKIEQTINVPMPPRDGDLQKRLSELVFDLSKESQIQRFFENDRPAVRNSDSPHLIADPRLKAVLYPAGLDGTEYLFLPLHHDGEIIAALFVDRAFLPTTIIPGEACTMLKMLARDFAMLLQAAREHNVAVHVARGLSYSLRTRTGLLESDLFLLKTKLGDTHNAAVQEMEDAVRFFKRSAALASAALRLDQLGVSVSACCDLDEIARTVCGRLKDGRIRLIAGSRPLVVSGERNRIEDIFLELLTNARDFAPAQHGDIRITITFDDRHGRVEIEDNGPGILPDLRPRLFDMFACYPADRMGLGLYYARSLARAFGGELTEVGLSSSGAHFILTLPKKQITELNCL